MKIKRFKDIKRKRKRFSKSEFVTFLKEYKNVTTKKQEIALLLFDFLNEESNAQFLQHKGKVTDIEKISFYCDDISHPMIIVSYNYGRSNNEGSGSFVIQGELLDDFYTFMEYPELFKNSKKYNL